MSDILKKLQGIVKGYKTVEERRPASRPSRPTPEIDPEKARRISEGFKNNTGMRQFKKK